MQKAVHSRVATLLALAIACISFFAVSAGAEASTAVAAGDVEQSCTAGDPCVAEYTEVSCGTTFYTSKRADSTEPKDPCPDAPTIACGTTFYTSERDTPIDPCDDEQVRMRAVDQMVDALESYADSEGTFLVVGAGHAGRGHAWALYEDGDLYPMSVANALVQAGHLPSDYIRDPLWEDEGSIAGDMVIYPCKDRVAVFTREQSAEPTTQDRTWWDNNGCNRYPIDRLGVEYFVLSAPL